MSDSSSKTSPNEGNNLLLISNRIPITIKRKGKGEYDFSMSSGGLVTGLSGLSKSTKFSWYGWPGMQVADDEKPMLNKRLEDEYNAFPVYLDDDLAEKHYNGFSSTGAHREPHAAVTDEVVQTESCGLSSTIIRGK